MDLKQLLQRKKAVALLTLSLFLVLGSFLTACSNGQDAAGDGKAPAEQTASADDITEISDEELVDSISYYNESPKTKDQIEKEHASAVTIVKQRIQQKKAPVKADLDNQDYREFVIGASMDLDGLSKQQQEQLAKLGKEVADYDNKFVNKRIKELEKKAKKEGLSPEEKSELIGLLPAENSVPLKPDNGSSNQDTDTGVDKNKKAGNTPANPDQGTEESKNEQKPTTPPTDEEESHSGGNEEQPPANEDETNEEQEQPSPGSGEGTDEEEQQDTPSNEEESTEEETPNGKENEDTGSEDGNNEGKDEGSKEEPADEKESDKDSLKEKNGYDREKALDYAYQWWNKRNNEEYGYYSRAWGGCYDCWPDCTNFTSQVLKAGGLVEWKSGSTLWYYNDKQPAVNWGLANGQYLHLKQRAKPATNFSELKVGDIIHADINGDGRINHAAVVSKIENGQIYVTQHTNDRKDHPLWTWYAAGYKVYGTQIGTADNTSR